MQKRSRGKRKAHKEKGFIPHSGGVIRKRSVNKSLKVARGRDQYFWRRKGM